MIHAFDSQWLEVGKRLQEVQFFPEGQGHPSELLVERGQVSGFHVLEHSTVVGCKG